MLLGLFGGGVKKQEKQLRATLSRDKFVVEFDRALSTFEIYPKLRPGKSASYGEVEAAARFMLEGAMAQANKKGLLKSAKDLPAVTTFNVVLVDLLGGYTKLPQKERRELQGTVPGYVFPRAVPKLLGAKAKDAVGKAVKNGILKHMKLKGKKKFKLVAAAMEKELTQFVIQRDEKYLGVLGRHLESLR
ncbi:MAG: hypothetical protein QF754_21090 [Alphaproteobacteria bacterium]|jgi:hypothetical protein|nr:hypothetical protein [Alphaproteobacteria bacterium]